jgi:HSP20 family protein
MAIKVQVKGDKKFEDTFATTECCNGTYVNDAFGQYGQTWATPVDALNLNPAYTTTMLDGLYSQTPASLVSLFGANAALPYGYQGFKPFAAGITSPVAYANTFATPFGTGRQSSLPFGTIANTMNTASQATPFAAANLYGPAAPFAGSSSFFGATVPATTDAFGTTPWGKNTAIMNTTSPITASQIASQLTAYGVCPIVASQIASTAITSPILAATVASQYGVNPAIVSQLIAKSSFAGLGTTAATPWLQSQDAWTGVNPIAWSNTTAAPFASAANLLNTIDMAGSLNAATPASTPWDAARNAFASIAQPQSSMNACMMPVDIYETEDEYILLSDMPGASIEDIDILVEGQMLVIKGLIKPASWDKLGMGTSSAVAVLQEKPAVKNIQRVFPITNDVLVDKLTAKLTDGILTVKLPKAKVGFGSTRRVAVATA